MDRSKALENLVAVTDAAFQAEQQRLRQVSRQIADLEQAISRLSIAPMLTDGSSADLHALRLKTQTSHKHRLEAELVEVKLLRASVLPSVRHAFGRAEVAKALSAKM